MKVLSIKEIGEKLTQAGKLKARPLCIYGTENIPNKSTPSNKINRCINYWIEYSNRIGTKLYFLN